MTGMIAETRHLHSTAQIIGPSARGTLSSRFRRGTVNFSVVTLAMQWPLVAYARLKRVS
jgi:hypothetical protein